MVAKKIAQTKKNAAHRNAPEKGAHEGKKNGTIIVAAAVLLIAIIAAVFMFGQAPQTPPAPPGTNTTMNASNASLPIDAPAAKLMFAAREKIAQFPPTYQIAYEGTLRNTAVKVLIYSYPDGRAATIETPYNSRSIFWKGNTSVMCEKETGGSEVCADATNSTEAQNYMLGVSSMFIDKNASRDDIARDRKLVAWGAMKISGESSTGKVSGRECANITYSLDYKKLTLEQMTEAKVAPVFDTFVAQQCFDSQYGTPLWWNITYTTSSQMGTLERKVLRLSAPLDEEMAVPKNLAGISQLVAKMQATEAEWQILGACGALNGTDADACYKEGAAQMLAPKYCAQIANTSMKEICFASVAVKKFDPQLCLSAGGLQDDCLYQVAINYRTESPCTMISNVTKREMCVNGTKAQ